MLTVTSPPLKGAGGMLIVKPSPLPILLTIPSPPLKGAGGMLRLQTVTSPPLKEVRELAQRSMCKGGDVNRQILKPSNRQIC